MLYFQWGSFGFMYSSVHIYEKTGLLEKYFEKRDAALIGILVESIKDI